MVVWIDFGRWFFTASAVSPGNVDSQLLLIALTKVFTTGAPNVVLWKLVSSAVVLCW